MASSVIARTAECRDGNCPTLYRLHDDGSIGVQGYVTSKDALPDDVEVPEGEAMVRIPRPQFDALIEQYLAQRGTTV
jgi:hypothetical protein